MDLILIVRQRGAPTEKNRRKFFFAFLIWLFWSAQTLCNGSNRKMRGPELQNQPSISSKYADIFITERFGAAGDVVTKYDWRVFNWKRNVPLCAYSTSKTVIWNKNKRRIDFGPERAYWNRSKFWCFTFFTLRRFACWLAHCWAGKRTHPARFYSEGGLRRKQHPVDKKFPGG